MSTDREALALLYRDIFEQDNRGAAILEDLTVRFGRGRIAVQGGIDAVLQTYLANGQRSVIDYITRRLNQANGVDEAPEAESQP